MNTLAEKQIEVMQWNVAAYPENTLEETANLCAHGCKALERALTGSTYFKLDGWEQEALEEFADVFILMATWAELQGYSLEKAIDERMGKSCEDN